MRTGISIFTLLLALAVLAGCGEETYESDQNPGAGQTGEVTGIILNAQAPGTKETSNLPHDSTTGWTVVDSGGSPIFASTDVRAGGKGICWAYQRAELASGKRLWLGANPREFSIATYEVIPGAGEKNSFKLVVSATTAAEMRTIPNFMDLIGRAQLVVLTGQTGQ